MFVPVHFSIEVRQALTKLERRGVIPEAALDEPLGQLETGLTLGPPLEAHDLARILALARHDRLAFYDAVYLDMAVESGVPLASRDGPLLAAATRLGVPVIDLR
jgi:predicted nucleic acid-binding protein